ncbi:MAG: hypothetical protein WDN28_10245 [Chthoniobacter sp.]
MGAPGVMGAGRKRKMHRVPIFCAKFGFAEIRCAHWLISGGREDDPGPALIEHPLVHWPRVAADVELVGFADGGGLVEGHGEDG